MAIRPIVVLGNPVLRQKARKVSRIDQSIAKLVEDMIETMRDAPGVGLAAPQIGVPLQVAVVETEPEQVHVVINRSEEHTSELQSRQYLVCRLLLEKKKTLQYTLVN